jgi:hypothetical protein
MTTTQLLIFFQQPAQSFADAALIQITAPAFVRIPVTMNGQSVPS